MASSVNFPVFSPLDRLQATNSVIQPSVLESLSTINDNETNSTHIFTRTEIVSSTTNILNCISSQGQLYQIVYSNISAIHTNLIITHQLINNIANNEENQPSPDSHKHMMKLKNYKYKQLLRKRYCDYIKKVREEDRDSEE